MESLLLTPARLDAIENKATPRAHGGRNPAGSFIRTGRFPDISPMHFARGHCILRRFIHPAVLCLLISFLFGCEYLQMTVSSVKMDLAPFYQAQPTDMKEAMPEECGFLMGEIRVSSSQNGPLIVVALPELLGRATPADGIELSQPGPYLLYVPRGKYEILAYADQNADGVCTRGELVGRCERPKVVQVAAGQVIAGLDLQVTEDPIVDVDVPAALATHGHTGKRLRGLAAGWVVGLSDGMFAQTYASMGLWNPSEFVRYFGVNILALEPFEPGKIPILFVHGSGGTPSDWSYVIENLDRSRYQPWFFYYPSGLRLQTLSDLLYEEIKSICLRHNIDRMILTAHSMGGLIVRAYFKRCIAEKLPCSTDLFVSLCTPWGGVERAKRAPEDSFFKTPPVWQDLAPESAFLSRLFAGGLPEGVSFCLFHASDTRNLLTLMKEEGDGVVSLASQLDPRARSEADCSCGFQETHKGVLRSSEVVHQYLKVLEPHSR